MLPKVVLLLFWVTTSGQANTLVVRFPDMQECEAKRHEFIAWLPNAVNEPVREMAVSGCLRPQAPGKSL